MFVCTDLFCVILDVKFYQMLAFILVFVYTLASSLNLNSVNLS